MKSFLIKMAILFLPVGILAFPLDYFISQNVSKSNSCNGEYQVWNDIFKGKVNSDVVIYGSSKAWVDINPHVLEDSLGSTVYNLGIDGHNFWLQYLRHLELLKFNTKPDCIVLSVDMLSLEKKKELYNMDQFLPYMLYDKEIHEFTSSYQGFSFYDYYVPMLRYLGKREALVNAFLYSLNIPRSEPMRTRGYMGMETKWNSDFDNARTLFSHYEMKIDSSTVDLFEKFLSECIRMGIKVIIVYSPEYAGNRDFFRDRPEIISLYQSYASEYNLPFLDYSDIPMCQQREYFYNSTHLNKTGSDLFSAILAKDLKQLSKSWMTEKID
jgi:hypothetical protein